MSAQLGHLLAHAGAGRVHAREDPGDAIGVLFRALEGVTVVVTHRAACYLHDLSNARVFRILEHLLLQPGRQRLFDEGIRHHTAGRLDEGVKPITFSGTDLGELETVLRLIGDRVATMVKHLQGQKVESRIDTGVVLVTPETMAQPDVQDLLNPPFDKYLP